MELRLKSRTLQFWLFSYYHFSALKFLHFLLHFTLSKFVLTHGAFILFGVDCILSGVSIKRRYFLSFSKISKCSTIDLFQKFQNISLLLSVALVSCRELERSVCLYLSQSSRVKKSEELWRLWSKKFVADIRK